jgi:uncharacterized protein YdaU (DUF1376 family)
MPGAIMKWYKHYPEAFFMGTYGMSLELIGAYIKLLDDIYDRDGLCIDDDRRLARLWRCRLDKARRLKQALILSGKIHVIDGRLVNGRTDREITSWRYRRDISSLGGKNSWRNNRRLPTNIEARRVSKREFDKEVANLEQYREKLKEKKEDDTEPKPL